MTGVPTPIGIAVVERDGRFLVGLRPEGVPLAGYAEFPGGKCEAGETVEACAVRECREEAGLAVEVVRLLEQRTWEYAHGRVELSFVLCRPSDDADPQLPFRWVPRTELAGLRFPEANVALVERIVNGA